MTTKEMADQLVIFCRKGDFEGAQKTLFANEAVSIEPRAAQGFEKETKGLAAILEKGKRWMNMLEKMDSCIVSEPMIAGNSFALHITMDVVFKEAGHRAIEELAIYQVADGKIVSETFYN